jgi:copper chaperone CopZ
METTAAETDSVFAGIASPAVHRNRRSHTVAISALIACSALCIAGVLFAQSINRPPQDGPRVEVDVEGMHCPIQCGMKVAAALETLPWVVPGSITANPKTGRVTFAVTSREAVDAGEVRRVIERAGFYVSSIHN